MGEIFDPRFGLGKVKFDDDKPMRRTGYCLVENPTKEDISLPPVPERGIAAGYFPAGQQVPVARAKFDAHYKPRADKLREVGDYQPMTNLHHEAQS